MSDQSYLAVQELLSREFDLSLLRDKEYFLAELANKINNLIQNDFTTLINILYRIDVDESKLKETLKTYPQEDAGFVIAKLIIERQLQKIKIRREFRGDASIDDEEKWSY